MLYLKVQAVALPTVDYISKERWERVRDRGSGDESRLSEYVAVYPCSIHYLSNHISYPW